MIISDVISLKPYDEKYIAADIKGYDSAAPTEILIDNNTPKIIIRSSTCLIIEESVDFDGDE